MDHGSVHLHARSLRGFHLFVTAGALLLLLYVCCCFLFCFSVEHAQKKNKEKLIVPAIV